MIDGFRPRLSEIDDWVTAICACRVSITRLLGGSEFKEHDVDARPRRRTQKIFNAAVRMSPESECNRFRYRERNIFRESQTAVAPAFKFVWEGDL